MEVLEKMVNELLMWYLESGNFLTPVQYGFRKVRSTSDALLSIESLLCRFFANYHHQVTVFFYLKKVHDTVWCYGILLSLFEFNLCGRLLIFIYSTVFIVLLRVWVGSVISEAWPL